MFKEFLPFSILFTSLNGSEEIMEVGWLFFFFFNIIPNSHNMIYPGEELAEYSEQIICIIKATLLLQEMPIKVTM